MGSRQASCVFFVWIIACVALSNSSSADEVEDAVKDHSTTVHGMGRKLKRDAEDECVLPPPLENGKFYPSARRCHAEDYTPACQMIPGTPVPRNWVVYFYCDPGYTLNTTRPVSVCLEGRWRPPLPACKDHTAIMVEGLGLEDMQAGPLILTSVGAAECATNDQCPDNKTCIVGECADSCDGLCGPNTDCEVSYHRPLCTCRHGHVGNPFRGCILGDPVSTKLLLAQATQVSVLDLSKLKITSDLYYAPNPKKNAPSVAYHYEKNYIFFTGENGIFRDEIRPNQLTRVGKPKVVVEGSGVDANANLAVDWVHDKLYWMSHSDNTVEVADLDGGNRSILATGLTHWWDVNNIDVDPYAEYLFLVSKDSLYRMNLDGTNQTILWKLGKKNKGVYVIALNTHKKRIYYSSWDLTTKVPYIDSCNYDGKDEESFSVGNRWGEIHAIDMFRDTVFFGHFKRGQPDEVWSLNIAVPVPTPVLLKPIEKGFVGFRLYHPEVQKE